MNRIVSRFSFHAGFLTLCFLYLSACSERNSDSGEINSSISVETIALQPPANVSSFVPNLDGPLRAISVSPIGALRNAEPGQVVAVTFSSPMTPLGEATPIPPAALSLEPATPGTLRWEGTQTLVFTPDMPLQNATAYTATLSSGLQALDGRTFDEPYTWTFETPRPRLMSSNPTSNDLYVDPSASIFLNYNQPLESSTLSDHFFLYDRDASREVEISASLEDEDTVIIRPSTPLRQGGNYTITIQPGVLSTLGQLASTDVVQIPIRVFPELQFLQVSQQVSYWETITDNFDPASGVTLTFSTKVSWRDILDALTITPSVDLPAGLDARDPFPSTVHRLPLLWQPQTRYTIRLDSLKDVHGQVLTSAEQSFRMVSYKPSLRIPSGLLTIEAEENPVLPMHVTNVTAARVGMERLSQNEVVEHVNAYDDWHSYYPLQVQAQSAISPTQQMAIDIETNIPEVKPFDLRSMLQDSTGIVGIHLEGPTIDKRTLRYKALAQVTKLGISAKFSPHQNVFFVTDLKTASPVAGASVTLRGPDNAVYWQGMTDEQGLARAPGWHVAGMPQKDKWNLPAQFVFVEKDGDMAFTSSLYNRGLEPYRFGIGGYETELEDWSYDLYAPAVSYKGVIFTDRGLYKEGETVHFKSVVRQKTDGEWAPVQDSILVEIQSPDGEEVFKQAYLPSAMGTFDFTWTSPATATLGSYYITATLARDEDVYITSDYFRIDAFRRATFSVDATSSSDQYIAGDFFEGTLSGRYLFGAAMQNQPVRYTLRTANGSYEPPGYPGYQFAATRYWYRNNYGRMISSGDTLLDTEGALDMRAQIPRSESGQSAVLTLSATVTDPAQQESSTQKEIIIHPGQFYLGLKPGSRFLDLSKTEGTTIDIISVDPAGQPVAVENVVVELVREQWNSVREVGADGRLRWRSERIKETKITDTLSTQAGRTHRLTVPVTEGGSYIFSAKGTDLRGNTIQSQTHFYATGSGYVAWRRNDDDLITLTPEKTTYEPGETARIMVQSPFEHARALVTVEREGIISSEVRFLEGSTPQIEIPITEAHMPNVFVSVMLLTGRSGPPDGSFDPGAPAFKIGYTALHVDPGTRHLAVEIVPDQETYRPGDEATVELQLRDANGKGVPGEIAFSAADAGVLNLINYTLPDPFYTYYGPRPLSVITSQTLANLVKQRNFGQKEDDEGGGGGMESGGNIRKDFRPLAYWNPAIQTDERGRATISFKLPESLTTFRFMATALTADNLYGNAQEDVVVTKPLVLKPALPRFARLGDEFEAGVLITNATGSGGSAVVQAEASDIGLSGLEEKTLTVDDGATKEVRFNWNTTSATDARFTFSASLGSERDAFEVDIPVLLPTIKATQATFASTDTRATEALQLPGNIIPGLGSFQAQLSSTALVGLEGAAEYLFTYPYGCLEQRTSRIRPLIAGDALLDIFDLEVLDADRDELINEWIGMLRSYWNGDGFSLWPGYRNTNHYVSAYVVMAMAEAREAGFVIPEDLRQNATDALARYVRNSNARPDYFNQRTWNDTRAMMLYALARHNIFLDQETYTLAANALTASQPISVDGQSHLLRTLLRKNDPVYEPQIQQLVQRIASLLRVESTTAYLTASQDADARWIFASDTRSTAFGLSALIESKPPEENRRLVDLMVRFLIQSRQHGHWASTQENAAVVEAFRIFQETYESEVPDFSASVSLAGRTILEETFSGRSLAASEQIVGLADIPLNQQAPVEITKTGTGSVYYTIRLESYTTDAVEALSQGLSVSRTIERIDDSGRVTGIVPREVNGTRTLQSGEMVRVTLRLTSPVDRNYVVVDDPLPAGLETLNAAFATTDSEAIRGTGSTRWWGSFNHTEMRDDRVLLFADYLTRGEHTYTYVARATTAGTFIHPPVQSELMYQPEINGRNASGKLIVMTPSENLSIR